MQPQATTPPQPLPRASTRTMRLYLSGVLLFLVALHIGLMLNLYSFLKNIF